MLHAIQSSSSHFFSRFQWKYAFIFLYYIEKRCIQRKFLFFFTWSRQYPFPIKTSINYAQLFTNSIKSSFSHNCSFCTNTHYKFNIFIIKQFSGSHTKTFWKTIFLQRWINFLLHILCFYNDDHWLYPFNCVLFSQKEHHWIHSNIQ